MYKQTKEPDPITQGKCPKCGSTSLLLGGGKLICRNCDHVIGTTNKSNKYGAKRTEFNGKIYDSKFEAQTAHSLELRKRAGDIKDYDIQFLVDVWVYREDGEKAFRVKHKVDFRIHHNDGSFELYEAKGIETDDYKWRRKFVENVFKPMNLDHEYTVIKQNSNYRRRK